MAENSWSLGRALRGLFIKPTIDETTVHVLLHAPCDVVVIRTAPGPNNAYASHLP